uniref:C-type lectin domain-containing protein n=1 Tax=Denticeps clupeoides TaxID=299321 RepID=A0AAY4ESJ8_9TELE
GSRRASLLGVMVPTTMMARWALVVDEPKPWEEAEAACRKEGGHLTSVDMSYDQAFIAGAVVQGKSDAWIGLRRQEDSGVYSWTDGWPVFFTHWGPGEPSNHKGEGCVSMHAPSYFIHGTWNDTACTMDLLVAIGNVNTLFFLYKIAFFLCVSLYKVSSHCKYNTHL